ncbi:unnamed protein product, partial [Ectocarpus sp. 6 AP-2014]
CVRSDTNASSKERCMQMPELFGWREQRPYGTQRLRAMVINRSASDKRQVYFPLLRGRVLGFRFVVPLPPSFAYTRAFAVGVRHAGFRGCNDTAAVGETCRATCRRKQRTLLSGRRYVCIYVAVWRSGRKRRCISRTDDSSPS